MKTHHANFKAVFRAAALGFASILVASCSSSQSTAKSPDGIYGERSRVVENQSSGNGYQQYFSSLREDEILTDANQYTSYDTVPNVAYSQSHSEWGGSPSQVIVNVYDNNWGMSYWNNYWYSPYYSWGWNHWHGYYGAGWGWNSWYGPGWGWGYNHWYGSPYYAGHYPYYGGTNHHHYYNYGRDRGRYQTPNSGRNAVSRMQTPSRGRTEATAPVRGRNNVAPANTGRTQAPVFNNSRNNTTQPNVRPRTNTTPSRNNNYTPARNTQPSRSGTTVSPSRNSGGGGAVRSGGGGGGRTSGGGGGRR